MTPVAPTTTIIILVSPYYRCLTPTTVGEEVTALKRNLLP
jgi:hypothetical protein